MPHVSSRTVVIRLNCNFVVGSGSGGSLCAAICEISDEEPLIISNASMTLFSFAFIPNCFRAMTKPSKSTPLPGFAAAAFLNNAKADNDVFVPLDCTISFDFMAKMIGCDDIADF